MRRGRPVTRVSHDTVHSFYSFHVRRWFLPEPCPHTHSWRASHDTFNARRVPNTSVIATHSSGRHPTVLGAILHLWLRTRDADGGLAGPRPRGAQRPVLPYRARGFESPLRHVTLLAAHDVQPGGQPDGLGHAAETRIGPGHPGGFCARRDALCHGPSRLLETSR